MTRLTLVAVLLYAALFVTAFEPYEAPRPDRTSISDPRYVVPQRYTRIFWRYVSETGVPADIACRLIQEESRWNRFARNVNANGTVDLGIMQLNKMLCGRLHGVTVSLITPIGRGGKDAW